MAQIDSLLAGQQRAAISGLEGSARAFALARLWLKNPGTWLVACPTLAEAEKLHRDLDFFLNGMSQGQSPVRLFPAYEVSPYQEMDPPPEVTARRMAVLWELLEGRSPLMVVTSAKGLTPRLCPPEYLVDNALELTPGLNISREVLSEALNSGGYTPVTLVEQVGDFAIRGSVVDFFGPLLDDPVRLEFFGDEIESIRRFDPADQRGQLPLQSAALIPCHPVDLGESAAKRAMERLRKLAGDEGLSVKRLAAITSRMELRAPFTGLESLLPLYYHRAGDLFSFLPDGCTKVVIEPPMLEERLEDEAASLAEEFEAAREEGRVVLPPPMLRRTPAQIAQRLTEGPHLWCKALPMAPQEGAPPQVEMRAQGHTGLHQDLRRSGEGSIITRFLEWCSGQAGAGRDVVLICRSQTQVGRLAELFSEREVPVQVAPTALAAGRAELGGAPGIYLALGALGAGFTPQGVPVSFVTEDEVLGAPRVVRQKAPPRLSAMLAALDDLSPGDLVVHVDFGVAVYEGLKSLAVGAAESDFLHLGYAGGDKLYLPADRMGLISKYRGPEDANPPLDRLGGKTWARTKGRVKKAVEAIARDLVELYAARSYQKGRAFDAPGREFREFEAEFPHQETPDQQTAIDDVVRDLAAPRPMDRLICGDVGYGKTEVALRAAFMVAMQGMQVALLVPTTVLAEQHYQTFVERLKDSPLIVESLSRFKTPAQQKKVLLGLAEGKVDIVIGTHRILQKDVVFGRLGLVVVDEEHRFGVKDKERLKKMRKMVDVLALTATPIPRTLQMSLGGLRDLSVINTPPEDRQTIKTYLAQFSNKAVRQAIDRELERGGQVFLVHNRVKDIGQLARLVQRLSPSARVGVAHGQMSEKALEKVMLQFVQKELDVLVCTTIIESGLDIPSANTIIINRADKLGLSQIYQLRGRVGRSSQKAYAYLFIKSENSLSRDAQKRLKALMDFTQLGAGFAIAMHDLQIRGAGNLLGEAQSGKVAEVGYELYVQMLEEAVARLKGEAPAEGPEPEMRLAMAAGLPEEYLPDPQVRLNLYRRLSRIRQSADLKGVLAELKDRFGPPPAAVKNLLAMVELKNRLRSMNALSMDLGPGALKVQFGPEPRVNLDRLLGMAREQSHRLSVHPDGLVTLSLGQDQSPLAEARQFLQYIGVSDN